MKSIIDSLQARKERIMYVRALCDAEEAVRFIYSAWNNAFLKIAELSQRANADQLKDVSELRALLDAYDMDGLRIKIKEIRDNI